MCKFNSGRKAGLFRRQGLLFGCIGEALTLPIDERFSDWSLARHEYVRSVNHLYPEYRDAVLHWNTERAPAP